MISSVEKAGPRPGDSYISEGVTGRAIHMSGRQNGLYNQGERAGRIAMQSGHVYVPYRILPFLLPPFQNPSIAGGRKAVARCFMYDCSLILFIIVMTCGRFLDTGAHFIISVVSLTTSYNHRYPTIFDRPQADAGGTLKARKVWAIAPVIWA